MSAVLRKNVGIRSLRLVVPYGDSAAATYIDAASTAILGNRALQSLHFVRASKQRIVGSFSDSITSISVAVLISRAFRLSRSLLSITSDIEELTTSVEPLYSVARAVCGCSRTLLALAFRLPEPHRFENADQGTRMGFAANAIFVHGLSASLLRRCRGLRALRIRGRRCPYVLCMGSSVADAYG